MNSTSQLPWAQQQRQKNILAHGTLDFSKQKKTVFTNFLQKRTQAEDYLQTLNAKALPGGLDTFASLMTVSKFQNSFRKHKREIISRIGTMGIRQFTNPAEAHSLHETALLGWQSLPKR